MPIFGVIGLTPAYQAPINGGGVNKGQVAGPTPDPYAKELAERRAAEGTSATPEQSFEDKYKAERAAEFAAQRTRMTAHAHRQRAEQLRAAEGQRTYEIPDAYAEGLKTLRERDARALAAKKGR